MFSTKIDILHRATAIAAPSANLRESMTNLPKSLVCEASLTKWARRATPSGAAHAKADALPAHPARLRSGKEESHVVKVPCGPVDRARRPLDGV
jgi:hypothetical protein